MSQRAVDLMPEHIRQRSQAGVRVGQYIVGYVAVLLVLIATITHSRLQLDAAREMLAAAKQRADTALATEAQVSELQANLDALRAEEQRYHRLAFPVRTSEIIATVVSALPPSITLDRLDFDSGPLRVIPSARSKKTKDAPKEAPRRWLTAELVGFAATDQDVAELVSRLQNLGSFQNVSLDFSRTRVVHERAAREFRLSFRVDLDAEYVTPGEATASAGGGDDAPLAEGGAS